MSNGRNDQAERIKATPEGNRHLNLDDSVLGRESPRSSSDANPPPAPDDNPFAPTPQDYAEVALEGDANTSAPVRKAAIIENQRLMGGHPDGSAPALDRLVDDLAEEDRASGDRPDNEAQR